METLGVSLLAVGLGVLVALARTDVTRVDASCDGDASGYGDGDTRGWTSTCCTSATCLVCHGSATTIVHVFEDEDAAAPEGYECVDERHGASAHSSFARASRNGGPCESSGMRARALLRCFHIFIIVNSRCDHF